MELDWAQNQTQEARGIEIGKNIGKEDLYKNKTTWLAWEMRLVGGWTLFTCLERSLAISRLEQWEQGVFQADGGRKEGTIKKKTTPKTFRKQQPKHPP
jgi:hypothetical protein